MKIKIGWQKPNLMPFCFKALDTSRTTLEYCASKAHLRQCDHQAIREPKNT
jgi:hypothetical protein